MPNLYIISSILMAALFLVSASVQFNDPDWYFWIPLYCCTAYVNLMSSLVSFPSKIITATGKLCLSLGLFLLSKVILGNYFSDNMVGILSLDMRHRLVREKIGSGLVISSMILQLLSLEQESGKRVNMELKSHIVYGMTVLAGISYGLSLAFLVYHEKEMQL